MVQWKHGRRTRTEVIFISNVSGKCDFKDHLFCSVETEEEAFNKFNGTKLYIIQPIPDDFNWKEAVENKVNIPETYYKRIEYSSIKDLVPLYPHLIGFASCDNTDSRNSVVCLSHESFVDREERECLEWRLKRLLTIYNRCKRKKIEFDVEEAVKEIIYGDWNKEAYVELANRVAKSGKKATIDGIHLKMHEYYRRELVDEMLKHGINPYDYDYARFTNK